MKKVADFKTYQLVKKLSFNDFNRWIVALYGSAYDDGKADASNTNTLLDECVSTLTEDRLMEILLSVKGIGKNRAREVVEKVLQEGVTYSGTETRRDSEECQQAI